MADAKEPQTGEDEANEEAAEEDETNENKANDNEVDDDETNEDEVNDEEPLDVKVIVKMSCKKVLELLREELDAHMKVVVEVHCKAWTVLDNEIEQKMERDRQIGSAARSRGPRI